MARFFDWTPDDGPATILRPQTDGDWEALGSRYTGPNPSAQLQRVIELARSHGVVTVLVEHRYIDSDYRSEHSAFYSTTFRRYPSVCDRLHFFATEVDDQLTNLASLQDGYRGYAVMRPLEAAPVGRTMMPPPTELANVGSVCSTAEDVHLFGSTLVARGMPFISQDAQYLRCAHASQWMVLRHSTLRYGATKWLTSDVHNSATGGVIVGRQLPSEGLSVHQMLASLGGLGLSPGNLPLPPSRTESRAKGQLSMPAVLCRHVNSQMPPIVVSDSHAWVVVGYAVEDYDEAIPDAVDTQHDRIVFYRHDDALGPYIKVPDPWNELHPAHQPWKLALTPLQKKCYLSAERAELLGRLWLEPLIKRLISSSADADISAADVTYRAYAIQSWEFKGDLNRIAPPDVAELYRLMHLPRFVWVVEALDKHRLDEGSLHAVMGEVLIDSTANHVMEPNENGALLGIHVAGFAASSSPDHDEVAQVTSQTDFTPYLSGCPVATY